MRKSTDVLTFIEANRYPVEAFPPNLNPLSRSHHKTRPADDELRQVTWRTA
jgi:hypothetical protein